MGILAILAAFKTESVGNPLSHGRGPQRLILWPLRVILAVGGLITVPMGLRKLLI
jgi:hypothetical protein